MDDLTPAQIRQAFGNLTAQVVAIGRVCLALQEMAKKDVTLRGSFERELAALAAVEETAIHAWLLSMPTPGKPS